MITETTQVWSPLVKENWEVIEDIPELHAFLSCGQTEGDVGFALFELIV